MRGSEYYDTAVLPLRLRVTVVLRLVLSLAIAANCSVLYSAQKPKNEQLTEAQVKLAESPNNGQSSASPELGKFTRLEDQWGERIHVVERHQTLREIAGLYSSDPNNAELIALSNQLAVTARLTAGHVLIIPPELRSSRVSPRQHTPGSANGPWQERLTGLPVSAQYLVNDSAPSIADYPALNHSLAGQAVSSHEAVTTLTKANVDMFVGEVKVLGQVMVDRVAVGNGAIVRSEVLANGELLAIAQAAGSTSLHLWHKDGSQSDFNIRVTAQDLQSRVRSEKMIRMKVKMVEFRKSALNRLGIDWGDSIAGPDFAVAGDLVGNTLFRPAQSAIETALPTTVRPFSSYFGIATAISSRINFLVSTGEAEMLAEPVLSCASGGSAKFLAGGEVPYPSIAANGQTTVDFKEYGIRLEVAPQVDEEGAVQADILTEISSIDPSVTIQGAPGLLTRRTQTQVNVMAGETIVIAGLLTSDTSKDVDQLPGIANLPVLGKLFRSENIRSNVSELVIFITPEVMNPASRTMEFVDKNIHGYSERRLRAANAKLHTLRQN